MSMIFDSIKTRNLDQVYEINLNQYYHHLVTEQLENAEIHDADFSVRIASGLNHPSFNAVVQTDITDNFDEVYPNIESFFSNRQLPYTWFLIPSSNLETLKGQLQSKGLRYIGDDVIVGVELEDIIRNISSPNSLYIESIQNYDKFKTWVDLYTKTRNLKSDLVEKFKKIYEDVDFNDPDLPFRKYIGWLNGEPVACSTLVMAGGIAVVYDETLLPRYARDFGIEEAINIVPLRKARDMGYKLGLVPTTVGMIKKFTGIGFSELFRVEKMVYLGGRGRRRRRR